MNRGPIPLRDRVAAVLSAHPNLLAAIPVLLFGGLAVGQWPFTVDDAYIVLRYGENLSAGGGYSFNPGDPIEGSTSLAWTLVSWLSAALGIVGPSLLKGVGLVFGAVAVWTVARRPLQPDSEPSLAESGLRTLAATALAAYVPFSLWSVGGLETVVAATMILLGLHHTVRDGPRQQWLAVFFLGSAALIRPEAALFWAAPLAVLLSKGKRLVEPRSWAPVAALVVVLASVTCWRYLTFHAFVPNTALTKSGFALATTLPVGAAIFRGWIGEQFVVGIALLALIGGIHRRWKMTLLLALIGIYWVYVVSLGNPDMGLVYRFYMPVIPLLFALAAVGGVVLHERFPKAGSIAAAVMISAPIVALSFAYTDVWKRDNSTFGIDSSLTELVAGARRSTELAQHLDRILPGKAVVALSDVGLIPYHLGRPVIDLWGLNDRAIALAVRQVLVSHAAGDMDSRVDALRNYHREILGRRPDNFIAGFLPFGLQETAEFKRCYRKLPLSETFWFNRRLSAAYVIYRRTCEGEAEL